MKKAEDIVHNLIYQAKYECYRNVLAFIKSTECKSLDDVILWAETKTGKYSDGLRYEKPYKKVKRNDV